MAHDILGLSPSDYFPVMEDDDFVRQGHHGAHDMLDDEDGDAVALNDRAQDGDQFIAFGRSQASEDFIKQQQLWLGG